MKTMKKALSLTLALCLAAVLCPAFAQEVTFTDMYGRTHTLVQPAARIVALTAGDCEILCALGGESLLAGIGEYCDYPASIRSLPVVQSGAETNVEQILALEPDVVLMGDMAQSKDVVDALEAMGICVAVSSAEDIEGIYTDILMIGEMTGLNAEAEALIRDLQSRFDAIRAENAGSGKTVYFEVSPLEWGLWTAGSGTFMDELAAMCGLKNAFADVQGWAAISEEQVLARDPDLIVTVSMYFGEGPTPAEEIMSRRGWENLSAVRNGWVYNADSDSLSRPAPRLAEAAEALNAFVRAACEAEAK